MHHPLQEKAALSKPVFEGDVWSCPMSKLMDAYEAAWAADKTPLLVDCTLPSDAEPGAFSPLETFFSYSSEGIIELKKAVVQVQWALLRFHRIFLVQQSLWVNPLMK